MFCKNCGSELAPGAKFCSECGTKVEEVIVRDFDTLAFEETTNTVKEAPSAEEAFKERVSFDWSNVIDEPQKKDIPQEIKSPWAATTDAIDEKELYEEMTQSNDKDRTMSYIDVLKADREKRERAAVDRSIEYTEVLEIDPELLGGTKPPKMHVPPLYEDIDEPVKTPFDDMGQTSSFDTAAFDAPVLDASELERAAEMPEPEPAATGLGAGKFELPDFLKRAVGFGAAKETIERIEKEPELEVEEPVIAEPIVEEPAEPKFEEPVIEEPVIAEPVIAEPIVEEPVIEEPVIAEPKVEEPGLADTETSSDLYLDEDIYLGLEEGASRTERMSRVDAHTLAGDYDFFEEEDIEEIPVKEEPVAEEAAPSFDENELFSEMAETPGSRSTGMTIAAPADEEEEIEALKRRLAELTGTLEIDPSELETAEEAAAPVVEDAYLVDEPVIETPVVEAPVVETPVVEGPKFEDLMFEPEVTPEDDALFEGLTPASGFASVEEIIPEAEVKMTEPELDDFTFQPEVTPEVDSLFEELTPASAPVAAEPVLEAEVKMTEPEFEAGVAPVVEEVAPVVEEAIPAAAVAPAVAAAATFVVGAIDFEPPTPSISDDQKSAFESLNFDIPSEPVATEPVIEEPVIEEPVEEEPTFELFEAAAEDDSPVVGFAPAVTEPVIEEPKVVEPAIAEPEIPKVERPVEEGPKTTDALSLEELEDLFGDTPDDVAEIETKKIDKFYTLYRKNEEFQRLLDEEYSKLRGDHITVPEDNELTVAEETVGLAAEEAAPAAAEIKEEVKDAAAPAFSLDDFITEEDARPVEDATIYQEMPQEFKEAVAQAEATEAPEVKEEPTFGLDGTETLGAAAATEGSISAPAAAAVAAGAAAVAGAVGAADKKEEDKEETKADAKADAKAAKAEARAAKKAAKEAKKAEKAAAKASDTADPQVEYENVDGGSTILTILAVLVALLLVALLVVILILHVNPGSEMALKIDDFIQNLTERFSAIEVYRGMRVM